MPRTVELADAEVRELLTDLMAAHHRPLLDCEVRVGVVVCRSDTGHAVSFAGARALAKIRRLNARDRLLMTLDAVIEVDAEAFEHLSEQRQRALLDHELTHLIVELATPRSPKTYVDGRPKLTLKPDDWILTGFTEIAERYGPDANEVAALEKLINGQMVFPFVLKPTQAAAAAGGNE